MGLVKCPRCELNYIQEGASCCNVCARYMKKGVDADEPPLCIECGENPAAKGTEYCAVCLREIRRKHKRSQITQADMPDDPAALNDVDNMDEMNDIEIELEDDEIPKSELEEIDRELNTLNNDGDDEDEEDEEE